MKFSTLKKIKNKVTILILPTISSPLTTILWIILPLEHSMKYKPDLQHLVLHLAT